MAAVLLASALVGCSSNTNPQAETNDSPPAASTATAGTETGASESDDPTAVDLAWAKEQLRWIEQMEELLGTVDAVKRIGRARMDTIEREAARQAIFNLIRCANRSGREYEAPPSLPTGLISDTLGKACGRLNRAGLTASSHLLVTDLNPSEDAPRHFELNADVGSYSLTGAAAAPTPLVTVVYAVVSGEDAHLPTDQDDLVAYGIYAQSGGVTVVAVEIGENAASSPVTLGIERA